MGTPQASGSLELHWDKDPDGFTRYHLYGRDEHGQLTLVNSFEEGPFDTAVDVAVWLTRAVARRVPTSRC